MTTSLSAFDAAKARPLNLAVFGVLADGAGSSAGVYPLLLAELLARGHRVEFFGNPGYVRPRSLEAMPRYRFHPLRIELAEKVWNKIEGLERRRALAAQIINGAYHRAAILEIERVHRHEPFDVVLCTDQQPLWWSELPLIAWPQGPPHTEAAALRSPAIAREVIRSSGLERFLMVQAFYAFRVVTARAALRGPDLYLCGSEWARNAWIRFGVDSRRVRAFPYPIDVAALAPVPPLAPKRTRTLLWLGRATPRKRLDLFLEGFAKLREVRPDTQARVVGDVTAEIVSRRALERFASLPGLRVEASVARADLPALFGDADVLLQPSQNENYGFSVAEALAAGRPVVGGPTNGTLDYAGDAAFRFVEYAAAAVAEATERALRAIDADGPGLSAKARHAASALSLKAVADRFCAVCAELCATRS